MSNEGVRTEVVDILRDVVPEVDSSEIDDDTSFQADLGMDSMDSLTVVEQVYERFGIDIPESDYGDIDTFGKLVNYVEARVD
ncbi:acyl carrier protein [Persicimonas caeni]|uniref:acyl carrier protein n=1 Tax=Persicimonas caeni TaxID=2292766 RepID=UPI00143D1AF0|nr:acyl carrier protein [Persicimonas caeni]